MSAGVNSALTLASYAKRFWSTGSPHCCKESHGSGRDWRELARRMIRTCFISFFIFNPAPYQAPVTVVAATPAARIIVRALGALDMVFGVLSIT